MSGRWTPVRLVEVSGEERPPVLLAYVQKRAFTHSGAQSARHFVGLGPNPTLEQMTAIADRFVVCRIDTQARVLQAAAEYLVVYLKRGPVLRPTGRAGRQLVVLPAGRG